MFTPTSGILSWSEKHWFDRFISERKLIYNTDSQGKLQLKCQEIIKELLSEGAERQCKLHLLLLFQESSRSITSSEELGKMITSLKSFYKNNKDPFLGSQVLVTIITLALDQEPQATLILHDLVNFLVGIASDVKRNHPLIRSSACQCLQEITYFNQELVEVHYDRLFEALEKDFTYAAQSYASLISLLMTNLVQPRKTDFRFSLGDTSQTVHPTHMESPMSPLDVDIVSGGVARLFNFLPLMTSPSYCYVLNHLITIIQKVEEPSPLTFKTLIPKLIYTYDMSLQHVIFTLQSTFGEELFSETEQKALLKQLVFCSSHPGLNTSHRLLYLNWMQEYFHKLPVHLLRPSYAVLLKEFKSLFPFPFDNPEIQGLKLQVGIVHLLCSEKILELIVHYLRGLKKLAASGISILAVSFFFASLYSLYSEYNSSPLRNRISDEIKRIVMDFITSAPAYSIYFLYFLKNIQTLNPESPLSQEILSEAVESITNQNMEQCFQNLHYNLDILKMAVEQPGEKCKPKMILKFIKNLLLHQGLGNRSDWLLGNKILSLCHSMLQYQRIDVVHSDLCQIFSILMSHFYDVDVQSRAKIFYTALYSLSESKIKQLFQSFAYCPSTGEPYGSLVIPESVYPFPSPIVHHTSKVLSLKREPIEVPIKKIKARVSIHQDIAENHFDAYFEWLRKDFEVTVTLPCRLYFESDCDLDYEELYGITINASTKEDWGLVKGIEVPVIKKSAEGVHASLTLYPKQSKPTVLALRAEFTTDDCKTYTCDLSSVPVNLEDLFMPLPVPTFLNLEDVLSWRRLIFNKLWKNSSHEGNRMETDDTILESLFKLNLPAEKVRHLVQSEWQPFLISATNNSKYDYNLGFILPQPCHVLLRLKLYENSTIVFILTDSHHVLEQLHVYFKSLSS